MKKNFIQIVFNDVIIIIAAMKPIANLAQMVVAIHRHRISSALVNCILSKQFSRFQSVDSR